MPDPDQAPELPPRPALTLKEAADAAGSSKVTMRRRLDDGAFPHAYQGPSPGGNAPGAWYVPIDDLLAAGFTLHRPAPTEEEQQAAKGGATPPPDPAVVGVPQEEHDALRVALDDERRRREAAEQKAALLEDNLGDLRLAMRLLEAGPTPIPMGPATDASAAVSVDSEPVSPLTWTAPEPEFEPGTGLPVAGYVKPPGWWARRRIERDRRRTVYSSYASTPDRSPEPAPGSGGA